MPDLQISISSSLIVSFIVASIGSIYLSYPAYYFFAYLPCSFLVIFPVLAYFTIIGDTRSDNKKENKAKSNAFK